MEAWSRDATKKKKIENQGEGKKSGPRVPERGAAKKSIAVSIFDDFCIIQAKITDIGLLLVPIHGDTLTNLKTENGGVVKGHKKKRRKWKMMNKKKQGGP